MTYFSAALTNDQKTKLRNTGGTTSRQYACDQLVFLCPNAPVFNARVNGAITGAPFASIAYDTPTFGAYTDIRVGQLLIVSPTNNARDLNAISFRVREDDPITSSTIPVNETSVDIANDSYIFVFNTYPLRDRLARPDPANPSTAQFKDYAKPFELLPPLVAGIQMSYVQKVDPDTGVATFSLDASDSFATDDTVFAANDLTFLWDFDDTGAINIIGGGLDQDNIEFEIDEGFQWGHLTIEDLNGTLTTLNFQLHPWGDTYTPVLGFDGAAITDDITNGHGVSVVAFTEVSDVLDNTWMTIVRNDEQYNGVAGQLIAGDAYYVEFVGLLSQESSTGRGDPLFSFVSDVTFEVTGIAQRLGQINMQAIGMRNNSAPSVWDEIDELMPWRAVVHIWSRHTTAATLIPLVFTADVKNTSYFYPYFATPLGGNLLSSINYILNSINASLEFWPNGTVESVRDIRYETELDRSGYLTLFDITVQDFYEISISKRHLPPVGKVYAEGGFFNATNSTVIACKSIAPGTAQQIGTDTPTLGQQVLTEAGSQVEAQTELNERAGNFNAIVSDDGNTVTLVIPGGYLPCFYASRNVLYTLTYSDPTRGISYTTATKWMCAGTSSQHSNEKGSRAGQVTLTRLIPYAAPGDTIPQISPGDLTPAIPDLAPFPAFGTELPEFTYPLAGLSLSEINPLALQSPNGQVAKKDGSTLIIKSDTQAYLLQNAIIATTPQAYEVTPPDLTGSATGTINIAYDIGAVNGGSGPASVQVGEIFTVVNGTGGTGDQMGFVLDRCVKLELIGATNYTPYPVSGGNFSYAYTDCDGNSVSYTTAIRSSWATFWDNDQCITQWNTVSSTFPWSATFRITEICDNNFTIEQALFDPLNTGRTGGNNAAYLLENNTGDVKTRVQRTANIFSRPPTWLTGAQYDGLYNVLRGANVSSGLMIYAADISGTAYVRYSSGGGASFGSALSVGATPGTVGGFDVSRDSGVSYAACAAKVRKATTLGGAYSDFVAFTGANPRAVCIPYFRIGTYPTAKQTTASDPDLIVGLDQVDSGGGSLYAVNGATGVKTDITPVAGFTVESANAITSSYGDHIAVIGLVAGDRRCYSSEDAGATWTLEASGLPADAVFIRTRRNDNRRAKLGSGYGQGFLSGGATMGYTVDWFNTLADRNLPITAQGFDVLG
jgi:hypothetical protein